jgi:hypothetical protein
MLPSAAKMTPDPYHGLFQWTPGADGQASVSRRESAPPEIPCPTTGRLLRISTVDVQTSAICPSCASPGHGGFVSFVGDLRMAYACPQCRQLVWLAGV